MNERESIMLENYLDVLTVDDVAEILRIDRRTVMHMLATGKLDYRKIGRIYRISKISLIKFLSEGDKDTE